MNEWNLWLDDQINDIDTPARHVPKGDQWFGAESCEAAKNLVLKYGVPSFMDLDHDLGIGPDGKPEEVKQFLYWLQENYPMVFIPKYNVHSANPTSRGWIDSFFASWAKFQLLEWEGSSPSPNG